jgi:ketosteroid isomerase-like protein
MSKQCWRTIDADVEWHSAILGSLRGAATVHRGHDGVREMLRDLYEAFSEFQVEFSEIRDLGDRIVAMGRWITRGEESGVETTPPLAAVVDFKNGKVIRVRSYLDPKEALAAVGLREPAMSQQNVEIVRHSIDAWNGRDLTTWTASLQPDAEIDWSRSRAPFKGVYRGRDGIETFWDVFWSTFEDVQVETHGFTEVGSEVLVPLTVHMRGREGIEVISRNALTFWVENGQIIRLRMFQEEAEALEAVGLGE